MTSDALTRNRRKCWITRNSWKTLGIAVLVYVEIQYLYDAKLNLIEIKTKTAIGSSKKEILLAEIKSECQHMSLAATILDHNQACSSEGMIKSKT